MTRTAAAFNHLIASIVVGLLLISLLWFVWYPQPLFAAIGVLRLCTVLFLVNVSIGPLLTLILFVPGKRGLKFDIFVVLALQLSAFAYGTFVLYSIRPVYIAAVGARFDAVQANDVSQDDLNRIGGSLPLWGPKWVGTRVPDDAKERERILFSALGGADYGSYPQHHVPLASIRGELLKNAKPILELRLFNLRDDAAITSWLAARGYADDGAVYLGLKARVHDMAVILDVKTATVIGIAPFKPWN